MSGYVGGPDGGSITGGGGGGDHHRHHHGGNGGDNTAGGTSSANGAEHTGNSAFDYAVQFFRSKGVPDYVIAGVLANLEAESSLNPGATNAAEGAVGIAQWEGNRDDEMRSWCQAHGFDSGSLEGQLNFLWHEMNTSESSAWHAVLNTSNAYDAGYAWASQYERCAHYANGEDQWATRASNASGFANSGLKGGTGSFGSGGNSGPVATGSNGLAGGNSTPSSASGFENAMGALGKALEQIPELRGLLQKAVAGGWTVARLQNAVENSPWYKQHSDTARQIIALQISDPATYQQELNNLVGNVQNAAHQLGWDLTSDQASQIATTALLTGNQTNQPWINQAISHLQDYSNIGNVDTLRGGMASTAQQLQQLALSYGLRVDPTTLAQQAQRIEAGFTTVDTFRNEYIRQAKSMFPALSDQLDQGLTVQDVAQPYIQSMSSLLEMDPSQINLFSPKIRAALQGTQGQSQNGKSNPTLMPLWQFENEVRSDPRWGFTNNAHQQVSSMLMQLGQDWGFAA